MTANVTDNPSAAGAVDAVTAQVVGNAMHAIANEVEIALVRAAYSPVIKESFDCSAAILGPDALFWAQADAIPLQLGVLASAQEEILARLPAGLGAGDVVLTNDPEVGAPHLNDFVMLAPVVAEGATIAYVATLVHYTDVGGKVPGSMSADATELFQEGIRIPPRRVVRAGTRDDELIDLLAVNSRTPTNLLGDLHAQLAATQLGVARVAEAAARHGVDRLAASVAAYLDQGERLARLALAGFRPGSYRAERRIDGVRDAGGEPAAVVADVTVAPDGVAVDFSASCDQLARPLNVVPSNGFAASFVALGALLGGETRLDGGLQRLLTVGARRGSIMNPVQPAPVAARALIAALAYECVAECLGHASGERAVAASSGGTTMPYVWSARPRPGEEAAILIDNSLTGGTGAQQGLDGLAVVENTVTNATNYPVEVLEAEHPVRIERYELRAGSGGPGRWRGGLGARRVVRFLADGALSTRGHRHEFPPPGILGGEPGAPTRMWLERDGERVPIDPQASGLATRAGDVLVAETPGGGGCGDPRDRDRDAIARDVAAGLLDAQDARRDYGWAPG